MFAASHGAVCARLLPVVFETNVRALQQRQPEHQALGRYAEVARILTGDPQASTADGAAWLEELRQALGIPPLSMYGLRAADFDEVIEKAALASSMQGNPVKLEAGELRTALERAL